MFTQIVDPTGITMFDLFQKWVVSENN